MSMAEETSPLRAYLASDNHELHRTWFHSDSAYSNHKYFPPQEPRRNNDDNDDNTDAIRHARDRWAIRSVHVNDSSAIIDAIDIEMLDISSDDFILEIYIVLDTNILLNYLSIIQQAVMIIEAEGSQLPIFFLIPGIVVSELDYQKNSKKDISYHSRKVSDWLASRIGNGKNRIKGQAYTQTTLPSGDWRQRGGLSNDELILDCCKYFSNIKRKDVMLCTADNNLVVQASANVHAESDLFLRGESAVVRPSRNSWSVHDLLKGAVPEYAVSTTHNSNEESSCKHRKKIAKRTPTVLSEQVAEQVAVVVTATTSNLPQHEYPHASSHALDMDIDMEESTNNPDPRNGGARYRDEMHGEITKELRRHVRYLTGTVGVLQTQRRQSESRFSSLNKFSGTLPSKDDWIHNWSVRECLQFLANVVASRSEGSFEFGQCEASSLGDFLASPGQKGARRGREWAKHDWLREIRKLVDLAEIFEYEELGRDHLAEYEYAVMEMFSIEQ